VKIIVTTNVHPPAGTTGDRTLYTMMMKSKNRVSIQIKVASGGPAGLQAVEEVYKQDL